MAADPFTLAVIGSGSGNMAMLDDPGTGRVALIEAGTFGGTCLNRGCIPSKMFVHTADVAMQVRGASQFGVRATLRQVDWPAIRDRIFSRVDGASRTGRSNRAESTNIALFEGRARFTGAHELTMEDGTRIGAEQIVIATGSRPSIPSVVTESKVEFYTSDTIMHIEALPVSMVILGGGYVAAEFAHIFSSLGVEIHIVELAATLMEALDAEISERFTAAAALQWDVHLEAEIAEVCDDDAGVAVVLRKGARVTGELLLVATGRQPNTEELGLECAGVGRDEHGHVVVDQFGRAGPGIWAIGDCSSPFQLKHVANAEARTVAHNLSHPDDLRPLPHRWVPSAVFSNPQVASVGARSQDLESGSYVEAVQRYSDTAYGWAIQDTMGICKIYADPGTGTVLGAHVLGDQAALLIAPLIQAVAHGLRVADLARGQYWIHPALSEVVENALLKLELDQDVRSGEAH